MASRRLVYAIANAQFGSAAKGVNFGDMDYWTHADVLAGRHNVDFTGKKLEDKVDPSTVPFHEFMPKALRLNLAFSYAFGSDWKGQLDTFVQHLYNLHHEEPDAYPPSVVYHIYTEAWDDLLRSIESIIKMFVRRAEALDVHGLPPEKAIAFMATLPLEEAPTPFSVPTGGFLEKWKKQHDTLGQSALQAYLV